MSLLAAIVGGALIATPLAASARKIDSRTYGYCKDGKKVKNIRKCKEFGGNK